VVIAPPEQGFADHLTRVASIYYGGPEVAQ
jgi:hypothetical protein